MDLDFSGEVWFWRGPAPWYFVTVPEDVAAALEDASTRVSYGWGMVPVTAQVGDTRFTTSLFPKDGSYIVPIKAAVRRAEGIDDGDTISLRLVVDA